jgi:phage FluMu protein Com
MAEETLLSPNRLLTFQQAGAHLGVGAESVRILARNGAIPYVEVKADGPRTKRMIRVRIGDIDDYIRKQTRRINVWHEDAEIWPVRVALRILNISRKEYYRLRDEGLFIRCTPDEIRHAAEVLYHRGAVKVIMAEVATIMRMKPKCPVCRRPRTYPGKFHPTEKQWQ